MTYNSMYSDGAVGVCERKLWGSLLNKQTFFSAYSHNNLGVGGRREDGCMKFRTYVLQID